MNVPLILYRLSGWTNNFVTIFVVFASVKCRAMWRNRYLFLAINFVYSAILEVFSSITAILNFNNLFLDYLYMPVAFVLKTLYLNGEYQSKKVYYFSYIVIFCFVVLQFFVAFDDLGYKKFNAIGSYCSSLFFIVYSFLNLTKLFKEKSATTSLRLNPDFWFTATIFCRSVFSFVTAILDESSYEANNELVLYVLFTSENFVKAGLYLGYYRGIKLMQ